MKNYRIEISIKISTKEGYNEEVIAESQNAQRVTCLAREVRQATTQLVRQAVDNMSHSAETGLAELIKTEPVEVESTTQEALTV